MRIDRLDLARYGRFTNVSLPFGAPGDARPDLHIVYGDNEAGKTTTLNALSDLVFGIEPATPYSFLHQAAALRLGGVLEISGLRREVIRLPKTGLLDADERPLPEGLFNQDLAGLDRSSYATMFCLDEKTLAAGGESILASRGDLGQLLFSATAGLADFADALSRLRLETESFYKAHGRKHELGELKRQLSDLKERRAALDMTAVPYARLIAAREEAQSAYEAAVRERGRLQADLTTLRRRLGVLPRLVEWGRLKTSYDALPEAPNVPEGWPEAVGELQRSLMSLGTRHHAAREEIERIAREIDGLPNDEPGLAVAARVARAVDLRARDATAAKDLPDRRAALRAAEGRVAASLQELSCEDCETPRQLLLPASLVNRLRQHIESLSGLSAAHREATAEVLDAQGRHADAVADLAALAPVPDEAAALSQLERALSAAEGDDSSSRLALAERACAAHGETLAERLRALAPWTGNIEALDALALPHRGELNLFAQEIRAAESTCDRWHGDIERLDGELFKTTRVRNGLIAEHALIDDAAAATSRAAREAAWTSHLTRLDAESASAFEQSLRADDATTSARFSQASDLSDLRTLTRHLTTTTAERDLARERFDVADLQRQSAAARLATRLAPFVGGGCATPLAAFETFLGKRERALDARDLLAGAQTEREAASAALAATRENLLRALEAAHARLPATPTFEALIAAGQAFLETLQGHRALRDRIAALARELAERRRQLARAEQERASWQDEWREALSSTWLAGDDVGRVRDALGSLADLGPALELREGFADRVAKMEADRAAFASEVCDVARLLGLKVADGDILDLADRVASRTRDAVAAAAARGAKIEDHRAAQKRLEDLRPELEAAQARAAQMTSVFCVETLDDLAIVLDQARRREGLMARLQALEIEVCGACSVEGVEEARAIMTAFEHDLSEERLAELEARCEIAVEHAQHCFAALERARDAVAAIDGDETAARLEEQRRTILLEIEERTMAHLALRAGVIAAESAIGLYRDRHRSSMMEQASGLFAALTRGTYSGLAAQSFKDGQVLVGLVANGGSRLSTEMSTATRHQLYLALRIAAYREFVKTRRPLPFVLDDVLETFDDERAGASLRLLADVATTGQVIYLTHHKHLCAIAQQVCPAVQVHDLGAL